MREQDRHSSRREVLMQLATGSAVLGLPLTGAVAAEPGPKPAKLKIVVVGGHPDDPELAAGGSIARYADLGHSVVCLYLTRGELGKGVARTPAETAAIRTKECEKACQILGARPLFGSQIDASTEISPARYDEFAKLLDSEKPDMVFTHWPIDQHRDHRTASLLVYDAWRSATKKFELFYFEAKAGPQMQLFRPTHYIDITSTVERKQQACFAHSHGKDVFLRHYGLMDRVRGLECGCKFAEAFVHLRRHGKGLLL